MSDIEISSEEHGRKWFWRRARWILAGCIVVQYMVSGVVGKNLLEPVVISQSVGGGIGMWLMGGVVASLFRAVGGSDKGRLLGIWMAASAIAFVGQLVDLDVIDIGRDDDQRHSMEDSGPSNKAQSFSIDDKELDDYLREVAETLPAAVDEDFEMTEVRRIGSSIIYKMKLTNENPAYFRPQFQSELSGVISQNLCTKGVSKRLFLDNGYVIVYRYADTTSQPLMEIHVSSNTCKDLAAAGAQSK